MRAEIKIPVKKKGTAEDDFYADTMERETVTHSLTNINREQGIFGNEFAKGLNCEQGIFDSTALFVTKRGTKRG